MVLTDQHLKEYALIVAGGKGTRFGGRLAKQFLTLGGKPVLLHTIERFYEYAPEIDVVLVLPQDDLESWNVLAKQHRFRKPLIVEAGGATRFQSVKNGLKKLSGNGLVAIHDGVRPLVQIDTIRKSFELAAVHGAAVAAVQLKESLRVLQPFDSGTKTAAVSRANYRLIQTPQTFQLQLIQKAYAIAEEEDLTDDASVAEKAGFPVFLFEGNYTNIKITTPEDLIVAEALMRAQQRA